MLHALLLAVALASPAVPPPEPVRSPEELVRAYLELRHPTAAQLRELVTDDVVWEGTGVEAPRVGVPALLEMLQQADAMLPDARYEIVSVAASGERVFAETLTAGTVRAAPPGSPAGVVGRYLNLRTVDVFEVHNGRIRKVTAFFDPGSVRRQLGLAR